VDLFDAAEWIRLSPPLKPLCAVLVGTGLRLDEALHLEWPDVSLEHRRISVQRGRKGAPKSGRLRYVPISDTVLGVLRAMKLARGDGAAGLDPALSPHDLRHTFASHYLAGGGDIFRLSKILGHSSVAVTEKADAHAADYGRVTFEMPGDAPAPVVKLRSV
jgi:integrase/recombinase XerD